PRRRAPRTCGHWPRTRPRRRRSASARARPSWDRRRAPTRGAARSRLRPSELVHDLERLGLEARLHRRVIRLRELAERVLVVEVLERHQEALLLVLQRDPRAV